MQMGVDGVFQDVELVVEVFFDVFDFVFFDLVCMFVFFDVVVGEDLYVDDGVVYVWWYVQ